MLTFGDQLSAAIAHSTGHRLTACHAVEPLPAQERILQDAVARARAAGLKLPRRLYVSWVDKRDEDVTNGTTWHVAAGVVRIYLNANLHPESLRHLIYHELKHASDFAWGYQLTRLQLEERATGFAARMMGWCT
jgi:hypothetical protein